MSARDQPGAIVWVDLAVLDANRLREFYRSVVGWEPAEVDMGDYADYNTHPRPGAPPAAGICHARGVNADLPPQWLIYIAVEDLEASMARCRDLGGEVVAGPKGEAGSSRFCVIRDPAGATAALDQGQA